MTGALKDLAFRSVADKTAGMRADDVEGLDGFALKRHDIAESRNLPVKNLGFIVKSDGCPISFVCHHGCIPASVKNLRIDFTAPLSVVGCGCGG